MSSIPKTTIEESISATKRSDTVIMGRQDFLSVLLRSIGGEFYKIRRRAMPKILLLIMIMAIIIVFSFSALGALATTNALHTSCTIDNHGQQHCISPNQADINEQKAAVSELLRLPGSLFASINVINFIGTISLLIFSGSSIGSEYATGTIHMMLTRGPTRTQFLLTKISTIIICILITLFLSILIGITVGALFNLTLGVAVNFSFFTGEWLLHAILYVLIAALGLFMYAMIALCLATLGKTTAAGVTGALIWWFFEGLLATILTGISALNNGPLGNLLQSIPDYFIGSNISTLSNHQSQYLINGASQVTSITNAHDISDMRAIIVLIVYLAVFIGIAWWINYQRDMTN